MSIPLVSIMIPTYNQEQYIEETIVSALSQTYSNIEVIVSDDNSSDNTESIIEKFKKDKRFRYYKNKVNKGRVGNYNHLLYRLVRGKYVLNLDGDDYLTDKEFIERAVDFFTREDLVLVAGKYKKINDSTGEITTQKSKYDKSKEKEIVIDGFKDCVVDLDSTGMGHLTELYPVQLAREIGFYNKDYITADSESILRLVMHGKVGFINEYVAIWRYHNVNASQYSSFTDFYNTLKAFDSVYEYAIKLNKDNELAKEFVKKAYVLIYRRIFRKIYQTKSFDEIGLFFKDVKKNKISKRLIFSEPGMIKKILIIFIKYPRSLKYLMN